MSEALLQQILSEVQGMKSDIQTLKSDMQTVKSDVQTLKSDVQTLKSDVQTLKSDVQTLKSDMHTVKSEQATMKQAIAENTERIRLIETNMATKKDVADIPLIMQAVIETSQDVKQIREDQKSIHEVLGEHEISIRSLRRKPV